MLFSISSLSPLDALSVRLLNILSLSIFSINDNLFSCYPFDAGSSAKMLPAVDILPPGVSIM